MSTELDQNVLDLIEGAAPAASAPESVDLDGLSLTEVPPDAAVSRSEPIASPDEGWIPPKKENWRPATGADVSLMIRASQAGLVRVPGEPITRNEVVEFLASKGLT